MSGGETSMADHRAWWTRAVYSVAYATRVVPPTARADSLAVARPVDVDSAVGAAPLARLIDVLGARSPGPTVTAAPVSVNFPPPTWLFALLAASLLAEWASRRLRGAP